MNRVFFQNVGLGLPNRKNMSLVVRKSAFCICENKHADQLRGNREADQRLCFRSLYFLNSKFQASDHLWLYSLVCVRPGRKPRRPVFSQRGSYCLHANKVKTAQKQTLISRNTGNHSRTTSFEQSVINNLGGLKSILRIRAPSHHGNISVQK